jgi:hypothetical protein
MRLRKLLLLFVATIPGTILAQTDASKNPKTPFSISIKAVPSSIQVGQGLSVEIVLTNLSDHPIDAPSAWMGSFDMVYDFDIHDSTGRKISWIAPKRDPFIDPSQSGTLGHNESKTEQTEISGFYNLNQPGSYVLQARRAISLKNPVGGRAPVMDLTKGVILSNTITITVVPAKQAGPQ